MGRVVDEGKKKIRVKLKSIKDTKDLIVEYVASIEEQAVQVAQSVLQTKHKSVFVKLYTSASQKLGALENILFTIQAAIPDSGSNSSDSEEEDEDEDDESEKGVVVSSQEASKSSASVIASNAAQDTVLTTTSSSCSLPGEESVTSFMSDTASEISSDPLMLTDVHTETLHDQDNVMEDITEADNCNTENNITTVHLQYKSNQESNDLQEELAQMAQNINESLCAPKEDSHTENIDSLTTVTVHEPSTDNVTKCCSEDPVTSACLQPPEYVVTSVTDIQITMPSHEDYSKRATLHPTTSVKYACSEPTVTAVVQQSYSRPEIQAEVITSSFHEEVSEHREMTSVPLPKVSRIGDSLSDSLPIDTSSPKSEKLESSIDLLPEQERLQLYEQQLMKAVVTHVDSPSVFWLQPEDYSNQLERMTEEIQIDYGSVSFATKMRLDQWIPKVSSLVCARYSGDEDWYRARVLRVFKLESNCDLPDHETLVDVLFIDYGNQERARLSQIRPLLSKYQTLPCFAFPCALSEVCVNLNEDLDNQLRRQLDEVVLAYKNCKIGSSDGSLYWPPEVCVTFGQILNKPVIVASVYKVAGCPLTFAELYFATGTSTNPADKPLFSKNLKSVSHRILQWGIAIRLSKDKIVDAFMNSKITVASTDHDMRFLQDGFYQESILLPDYMICAAQAPEIKPLPQKKSKLPKWTLTGKLVNSEEKEIIAPALYSTSASSMSSSVVDQSFSCGSISDGYQESDIEIPTTSGESIHRGPKTPDITNKSEISKLDIQLEDVNNQVDSVQSNGKEVDSIMMDPVIIEAGPRRNSRENLPDNKAIIEAGPRRNSRENLPDNKAIQTLAATGQNCDEDFNKNVDNNVKEESTGVKVDIGTTGYLAELQQEKEEKVVEAEQCNKDAGYLGAYTTEPEALKGSSIKQETPTHPQLESAIPLVSQQNDTKAQNLPCDHKEKGAVMTSSPDKLKKLARPPKLPKQCEQLIPKRSEISTDEGISSHNTSTATSVEEKVKVENSEEKKAELMPLVNVSAMLETNSEAESDPEIEEYKPFVIKTEKENSFRFLMSVIESPSKFYVHVISTQSQRVLDKNSRHINRYFDQMSPFSLKALNTSFEPEEGKTCCAQFKEDGSYYRAVIISLRYQSEEISGPEQKSLHKSQKNSRAASSKLNCVMAKVFYVDYGNTEWISRKLLYPVPDQFKGFAAQAVCCCLYGIEPAITLDLTDSEDDDDAWPDDVSKAFMKMTGFQKQLIGYPISCMDGRPIIGKRDSPLELIIRDLTVDNIGEQYINDVMVNKGYAREVVGMDVLGTQQTDVPDQTVNGKEGLQPNFSEMSDQAIKQNICEQDREWGVKDWNPMAEEYLSIRNSYQIDTDDPGVALSGVKADENLCKFFSTGRPCYRGENCPYKHILDTGGPTSEKVAVYSVNESEHGLTIPKEGSWVVVDLSAIFNPAHFFVVFPFGTKAIQDLYAPEGSASDEGYDESFETLDAMMENLNEYYSSKGSFRDTDLCTYALGEIVVTQYSTDQKWYRAKVVNTDSDAYKVEVFYVDFGNTEWVEEKYLRQIEPQFMHLPFQTLECFMAIEPTDSDGKWSQEARSAFSSMTNGKIQCAHVLARGEGDSLIVDLFDTDGEELNIGKELIKTGHAHPVTLPAPTPRNASGDIFLPG